jgi:CRP-like cAMP-binding protein
MRLKQRCAEAAARMAFLRRQAARKQLRSPQLVLNRWRCGGSPMLSPTPAQRHLLKASPLFSRLADDEANAILAHATIARYREGAQIFAKGDPGTSMMAVLSGEIMIRSPSADGRQVVLGVVREGEVFGEIALLDGKDRTADAGAMTACELLVVERRDFMSLLERRPDLCIQLLQVLCDRIRKTDEQVEDLVFLDLESRIAKTLVRLANEQRNGPAKDSGAIRISQRALGEIVGASRESVNKHLQDWKRAGVIALEKGRILIRDAAALTPPR